MKSMTGYGKNVYEAGGKRFAVEIKSVNHRFLDIGVKTPKILSFCEPEVRKILKNAFSRGHVDVYINYEDTTLLSREVEINLALAEKYLKAAENLKARYGILNDLTAASVLSLPEIAVEKDSVEDEALLLRMLKLAVENATFSANEMRIKEGGALKLDIEEKLHELSALRDAAEARAPKVADEYREKLAVKMTELLSGVSVGEEKLINEVAFFAERSAVDEELARLSSHFVQMQGLLEKKEPAGKELDFIMQEINREINTIGSKANDLKLTQIVLDMKAAAEKIREQVQNVE